MMRMMAIAVLMFLCLCASAQAKGGREVVIADPYIELHTGPGRGYPIFHVADRGDKESVVIVVVTGTTAVKTGPIVGRLVGR